MVGRPKWLPREDTPVDHGYWKGTEQDHVPDGYEKVLDAEVFVDRKKGKIVVLGWPPDTWPADSPHNCDEMGCGSLSHCLVRGVVTAPVEFARLAYVEDHST